LTPRRALLAAAAALSVAAAAPSAAAAADQLAVDVTVNRFVERGGEVVALGRAAARQTGTGAVIPVTEEREVKLQVDRGGGSCRVLSLELKDLYLQLLGLTVDASAINLHITGQKQGGALGKLFCRLSTGLKLGDVAATRAAARSLNRELDGRPMRLLAFQAAVEPTAEPRQAAPGTCEVLDLLLGPLNLDLLGLVVDLYGPSRTEPVRVHVTADPSKGVLGQSFCRLASAQPIT
ncbi:MAG TPA: hypothetical protein VIL49_17935, partial [Capillimicrobium sp.]